MSPPTNQQGCTELYMPGIKAQDPRTAVDGPK
jgi:hypothetical protein